MTTKAGLAPVLLAVLLDLVGFGLVIPLLPLYAEQYGASPVTAIALMGVYSVAQFLFTPIWGGLSDRIGRRPVMLVSIAGTAIMLAIFAAVSDLYLLFIVRFLHGACAANISTAQAYVADITTPANRTRGMGLIGAAFGVGFTLGPWVGGELATFGLAVPIWVAAGLSAFNFVWAFFGISESRPPSDRVASVRTVDPRRLLKGLAHPVVGMVLLLTFTATLAFAMMEYTFALVAEHLWFPDLAIDQVPARVGRIFGIIGVIGIVIQGGLIGRLSARFGEGPLIIVGYLANAIGLLLLVFVDSGGMLLNGGCVLLAVGMSLTNPSLSSVISRNTSADEQGAVLGVNQSLSALARATAPWFAMIAYGSWFSGGAFMIGSLLMAVALVFSIPALRRVRAAKAVGGDDPPESEAHASSH